MDIQVINGKKEPFDFLLTKSVNIANMDVEKTIGVDAAYNYILKKQRVSIIPGMWTAIFFIFGFIAGIGVASYL